MKEKCDLVITTHPEGQPVTTRLHQFGWVDYETNTFEELVLLKIDRTLWIRNKEGDKMIQVGDGPIPDGSEEIIFFVTQAVLHARARGFLADRKHDKDCSCRTNSFEICDDCEHFKDDACTSPHGTCMNIGKVPPYKSVGRAAYKCKDTSCGETFYANPPGRDFCDMFCGRPPEYYR